jgi:hypothetical protein
LPSVRDDVGLAVGDVAVGDAVGSDVRCVMLLAWRCAVCDVVGLAVGDIAVGVAVGSDVR